MKDTRYRYAVLGAGRQGTAAAYDLLLHGSAGRLVLADSDLPRAKAAEALLRKLLGKHLKTHGIQLHTVKVDGSSQADLKKVLKDAQATLSALPYFLNPGAAAAAVAAKSHFIDLGGHLDSTKLVMKLDGKAKKAGVTLVPDCGLAPGMCNTLAVCAMETLSITRDVRVFCGGLPQKPKPPLGYKIVFSLDGLLASYFGKAFALQKGEVAQVPSFTGLEEVDFGEPLGKLEAFFTGGGAGTCPWTFQGRLQNFEYKTVRYPGHFEKVQLLREMGFLDEKPVQVNGGQVVPRALFKALVEPRLRMEEDKDLVVLRVLARGQKDGKNMEVSYDLVDYHDPKTGFSAMERTTGFSAAVVLEMLAKGQVSQKGAVPLEKAVPGRYFLEQVRKRGIRVQETMRSA